MQSINILALMPEFCQLSFGSKQLLDVGHAHPLVDELAQVVFRGEGGDLLISFGEGLANGGSPLPGAVPRLSLNDGAFPGKPDHLTGEDSPPTIR